MRNVFNDYSSTASIYDSILFWQGVTEIVFCLLAFVILHAYYNFVFISFLSIYLGIFMTSGLIHNIDIALLIYCSVLGSNA